MVYVRSTGPVLFVDKTDNQAYGILAGRHVADI
ncbi:MAG: hypothetical protein KatS3mg055_0144 [Chloroflexus sp.]|nr:MAG: hypothetical protein KatS3mg055_0144 [Chloroflexus sp.]